jgi:glucokinase
MTTPSALIANIGGTNARFAVTFGASLEAQQIHNLAVDDFANIDQAICHYLERVALEMPQRVCIAIACPTHNDRIRMTNNGWDFSKAALQRELGIEQLSVINDYAAMALAAPNLTDIDRLQVGTGQPLAGFPVAVLGPGTGLGVSGLAHYQGHPTPIVTEGGHVDFAPTNEQEIEILRFLLKQHDHVSAERLLSGMGLENIYQALAAMRGEQVDRIKPAQISALAFESQDALALATLDQFCAILGSVAGNTALTYGAQGGVFVTGGIIPRMLDFFERSSFRQRFEAKGRFVEYMQSIPTYVMTHKQPGLLGAAAAALD